MSGDALEAILEALGGYPRPVAIPAPGGRGGGRVAALDLAAGLCARLGAAEAGVAGLAFAEVAPRVLGRAEAYLAGAGGGAEEALAVVADLSNLAAVLSGPGGDPLLYAAAAECMAAVLAAPSRG